MSSSLGNFFNKLATAAFEPPADVLIGELFTNVSVVILVQGRVTGNADDDACELTHPVWQMGKDLCNSSLMTCDSKGDRSVPEPSVL